MTYKDYRPYIPTPAQSRIAAASAEDHAKARLSTPRAAALFEGWAEIAKQPYTGVTTGGAVQSGLFELAPEGAPSEAMAQAATRLIAALTPDEKARALRPVEAPEWRQWQNTEILVETHGLRLERTSAATRDLVLGLLRVSLSDKGYDETLTVMQLNAFLGEILNAPGVLNEWSYNFCLYGTPSVEGPWGWQLWGHHLAVNCLTLGGQMILTPCFMGAEPSYADTGRWKGKTLFQDHERLGLELMNLLPQDQQDRALVSRLISGEDLPEGRAHFADYLMQGGAHQDNRIVPYEGAVAGDFAAPQKNALLDLVEAYIGTLPDGPRAARMEQFERHLGDTHFCWIGGQGPEDPFYYRIQSPITFIEFDQHPGLFLTNTVPLKFHIHTVVRTPNGNDYGVDLLRQHYAQSHADGPHHHHDHTHDHD